MCCVMCVGRGLGEKVDKARHKCAAERRRPVCKLYSVNWFRSRGGLAVHRCRREEVV